MRERSILGFAFGLSLGVTSAHGAEYHVAPTGNDQSSGTTAAPWKTLQKAIASVQAGDTVLVANGAYAGFLCDGVSGSQANPIVLRSEVPQGAKITSAGLGANSQDFIQLSSCSYIVVDGFEVSAAPRSCVAVLGNLDDGSDARGNVIQNLVAHDCGGGVLAGRHDGIFSGFALDLVVQDNVVHDTSEHGIYVSNAADNPIIRRNKVYTIGANCIQINADLSTGGDGLISNWLIESNVVNGCGGGAAINLDGAIFGTARNNLVYGAKKAGIALFQGDGAEASHDNLIVNNTIYNPTGTRAALSVADGANNNVVFNNILYSGSGAGLEVLTQTGLLHDYNLISSFDGTTASPHESSPQASSIFAAPLNDDYTLAPGSPAWDQGASSFGGKTAPTTDIHGSPRPSGTGHDIGAFEMGSAGAPGAGGTTGSGGAQATGGSAGSGGNLATGGAAGNGGNPATGGSAGSGGNPATGGSAGHGGNLATGGSAGNGGNPVTGGAAGNAGSLGTGNGGSAGVGAKDAGSEKANGSADSGACGCRVVPQDAELPITLPLLAGLLFVRRRSHRRPC
jgi:hypothetical protein